MVGFENLSHDQQLFLKVCMTLKMITKPQIQELLVDNTTTKEMSLHLLKNGVIDVDGLKNAVDLMKISSVCPYCDELNIYQERSTAQDICKHCQKAYPFFSKRFSTLLSGTMLQRYGNYQILEEIGSGSMGVVYKAKHNSLDRYAALKILKAEKTDSVGLVRFQTEAKAISVLKHPNIVSIYDTGEQNGQYYIAMEYVDGKSLVDLMKDGLTPVKKIEIVIQIAYALEHAHANKIIHRDIKPENIMLSKEGEVKITDFGLARSLLQNNHITQENVVIGTPLYMSPEQIQGDELTGATDIYSLGVILYELITGKTPFFDRDTTRLLHKILSEPPVAPKLLKSIPATLNQICMKAIEKDKNARYSSARDMALALEKFLKGFSGTLEDKKIEAPYSNDPDFSLSERKADSLSRDVPKIEEPMLKNHVSSHAKRVVAEEDAFVRRPAPAIAPARKVTEAEPSYMKKPENVLAPARRVTEADIDSRKLPHAPVAAKKIQQEEEDYVPVPSKNNPIQKLETKPFQAKRIDAKDVMKGNACSIAIDLPTNPGAEESSEPEEKLGIYDLFLWTLLGILIVLLFYRCIG
ncbi:MAG: serine/threonine protein kinase [Candidatus Brocadiae bacterium]|nr:serine/threonine protein kinase [Candidatus Brocadiia bacterium]